MVNISLNSICHVYSLSFVSIKHLNALSKKNNIAFFLLHNKDYVR